MNIDGKYPVIGDCLFGKCLTKAHGKESETLSHDQASPRINWSICIIEIICLECVWNNRKNWTLPQHSNEFVHPNLILKTMTCVLLPKDFSWAIFWRWNCRGCRLTPTTTNKQTSCQAQPVSPHPVLSIMLDFFQIGSKHVDLHRFLFLMLFFFKLRENLQTCHGDLEKMMMTDEAGSKPGSFWLGRGLLEKSGHTKCWDTKVELVFFNLVTNKMFHTPPKLTWIHKMVVWKRWPLFKYGHFLGIYLKFLVGICRVL